MGFSHFGAFCLPRYVSFGFSRATALLSLLIDVVVVNVDEEHSLMEDTIGYTTHEIMCW